MTDPIGQTGKAKSIELESQKVKDVAKCQDVDWKENDRQANKATDRLGILPEHRNEHVWGTDDSNRGLSKPDDLADPNNIQSR